MANPKAGPNSSSPTTAEVVGGVYNVTPPVLVDGQATSLQVDVNGKLITSGSGGGGGNVNITGVNSNPPALANPLPVELSDGTQAVGTAGNPLSVNVITGGGSNASVGATGAAIPASATEIGGSDGALLRAVKVDTDGTLNGDLTKIGGSAVVTAAAGVQLVGIEGRAGTSLETTAGVLDENIKNVGNSAVATAAAGIQKVGLTDGTGTAITSTGAALDVNIKSGITNPLPVSGTVTGNQGTAAANTASWPVNMGGLAEATAAWTSATSGNTTLQINTAGFSTVIATFLSGTISGGIVTFEASDTTAFTTAYPLNGLRQINPVPGTLYTIISGATQTYIFNVAGWAAIRMRLSTVITGAGTLNVGLTASAGTNAQAMGGNVIFSTAVGATAGVQSVINQLTPLGDNQVNNPVFSNQNNSTGPLAVSSFVFGGAFSGTPNATLQNWSKLRTPTIFKTASATASGNTAIWTPGTGNKFRLMRFIVDVTDNAATAGGAVITVSLQDAAAAIGLAFDVFVPASGVTTVLGGYSSGWIDLGNGFLSAAANNALNVNLTATITGGVCRVTCCGTEE